jgi:hypothetical protein
MPAEKWRSIYFFHNVWTIFFDRKGRKGREREGNKRSNIEKKQSELIASFNDE